MKLYRECKLKEVLIGAPILLAKQGSRTSDKYAIFPNDYEGERIYIEPIEITEEEIATIIHKIIWGGSNVYYEDGDDRSIKATEAILSKLKAE